MEPMTCAACDLAARLRSDLILARNELRAVETMFRTACARLATDALPAPTELRAVLADQRLRVVTLEQVLADLWCDHALEAMEVDDAAA